MSYREGNRLSLQSGRTALHGAPKAVPMCLAVFGRYDEVQGLTDSLRERVAKRLLGASAPEADHPVSIGEHDRFIVHASPRFVVSPLLPRDPPWDVTVAYHDLLALLANIQTFDLR